MNISDKPDEMLTGPVNHFALLKHDADNLARLAVEYVGSQMQTMFARSAILLYVVSLEALINRVIEDYWPLSSSISKMDVAKWITEDKWYKVPLQITGNTFCRGMLPFQYLKELIDVRNDFVHAKPETYRVDYVLQHDRSTNLKPLSSAPHQPKYNQIGLFRAPTEWIAEDANGVKEITEKLITGLIDLLPGQLTQDWLYKDILISDRGKRYTVTRGFTPEMKSSNEIHETSG